VDFDLLKRVFAALEARGVQYAIFGAVALNLHGIVRNTEDLDIFVAPDPANIDRLKAALRDAVDDPEIDTINADELLGDTPAVRYVPPSGLFYIDIVTRLGDAFRFADLQTERLPYDDLTVTVVTPRTLYDMKKNTVRGKDRLDADVLQREFDLERE
jgi:acylphosphatase